MILVQTVSFRMYCQLTSKSFTLLISQMLKKNLIKIFEINGYSQFE